MQRYETAVEEAKIFVAACAQSVAPGRGMAEYGVECQKFSIFAINMAHEALKIQKDRTSGRRALQAINHPAGERHCAASLTLYFICKLVSWGWAI
ncbi:MAG: hypothetical protein UHP27_04455, partial [Muribaculaceae bacterium]|nr:hypothetical protein [Muribaculaceae bacterium]